MITTQRKGKNKYMVTISPIELSGEECNSMKDWCTEQFGPGGRNKQARWRYGWVHPMDTFHFKNEADVTLFMLRWA